MNPDSEQTLNRFAAGELDTQEENDFLAFCEIDAARYRRATLAIVEHRRMTQALRAFAPTEDAESDPPRQVPVEPRKGLDPERNQSHGQNHAIGLAAMLAVAAIGGFVLGFARPWQMPSSEVAGAATSPVAAPGSAPDQLATNSRSSTNDPNMISLDPADNPIDEVALASDVSPSFNTHSDHDQSVSLPLRQTSNATDSLATVLVDMVRSVRDQRAFSERSRQRLQQSGWEVEEHPQIYLLSTPDGHQYAIPTHDANIRLVKD